MSLHEMNFVSVIVPRSILLEENVFHSVHSQYSLLHSEFPRINTTEEKLLQIILEGKDSPCQKLYAFRNGSRQVAQRIFRRVH